MATESVTVKQLDAISATRTVETRREKSAWDITLTRGADISVSNVTVHELRSDIEKQALQKAIHVAELALAEATRTPPPTPEDPDPDWVDEVAVAQGKIDAVDTLVADLEFLLGVLVEGGEL